MTRATLIGTAILAAALPTPLLAHSGEIALANGFVAGFVHPLLGLDHLSAMVAVGLWGAQLGRPAIWILPIAFPLAMTVGAATGVLSPGFPFAEVGVAFSAIMLGAAVAMRLRPPIMVAMVMVGLFALCHGYTHGTQLPGLSTALPFSMGFLVATGGLHGIGILIGGVLRWPWGADVLRLGGALVATIGVWVLMPLLH